MKTLIIILASLISFNTFADEKTDLLRELSTAIEEDAQPVKYLMEIPHHCLTPLTVNLLVKSDGIVKAKMASESIDVEAGNQILEKVESTATQFQERISRLYGDEVTLEVPVLVSFEARKKSSELPICDITIKQGYLTWKMNWRNLP